MYGHLGREAGSSRRVGGEVGDGRLVVSGNDGSSRSAKETWGKKEKVSSIYAAHRLRWGMAPTTRLRIYSKVKLLLNNG